MKTAKVEVSMVMFDCPYCGEGIVHPMEGTFGWSVFESFPEQIQCWECKETCKLPRRSKTAELALDPAYFPEKPK